MDSTPVNIEETLAALMEIPQRDRLDHVAALGAPEEVIASLAEEAERWVIVDLGRAREATAILMELASALGHPGAQARAWRARAHALAWANEFGQALAALTQSLKFAAESDFPRSRIWNAWL